MAAEHVWHVETRQPGGMAACIGWLVGAGCCRLDSLFSSFLCASCSPSLASLLCLPLSLSPPFCRLPAFAPSSPFAFPVLPASTLRLLVLLVLILPLPASHSTAPCISLPFASSSHAAASSHLANLRPTSLSAVASSVLAKESSEASSAETSAWARARALQVASQAIAMAFAIGNRALEGRLC